MQHTAQAFLHLNTQYITSSTYIIAVHNFFHAHTELGFWNLLLWQFLRYRPLPPDVRSPWRQRYLSLHTFCTACTEYEMHNTFYLKSIGPFFNFIHLLRASRSAYGSAKVSDLWGCLSQTFIDAILDKREQLDNFPYYSPPFGKTLDIREIMKNKTPKQSRDMRLETAQGSLLDEDGWYMVSIPREKKKSAKRKVRYNEPRNTMNHLNQRSNLVLPRCLYLVHDWYLLLFPTYLVLSSVSP